MERLAIGIMSGTSLDGIDVVIAKIEGSYIHTHIQPIACETFPFEEHILKRIKMAIRDEHSSSALICSLNFELGEVFADAVIKLCKKHHIKLKDVDFIASHGQTVFHITHSSDEYIPSSLQLGEGSVIAQLTQTTVVSNFRCADIAAGGNGAPLVPYADYILFHDEQLNRSIHNIGGISNLTVLIKNGELDDVIAFDTGPGNMMIDYACKKLFNINYDENGAIARKGKPIKEMLEQLMDHPYFKLTPPKSTGRELFGEQFTEKVISEYANHPKEDIISTLTYFTAKSIAYAYSNYVFPHTKIDEIIFSGGGALNQFCLELIAKELKGTKIKRVEAFGYDGAFKEALAFIILGNETINFKPSNVKNATGAKKSVILGQINYINK